MKNPSQLFRLIIIISLFYSCKSVDLRTEALKKNTISNTEERGKNLLNEAKIAMGYDKLSNSEVYETTTTFNWNKAWLLMPMNAFPGNNKKQLQMRLATNSFDGQIEYLEGRKEKTIQGVNHGMDTKKKLTVII